MIFLAFATAVLWLSPASENHLYPLFIVAAVPVFVAGLAEDVGFSVSPNGRLVAAALSCIVAITLLNMWIRPPGLAGVDFLMKLTPVALGVTILWSAGLCHAFNLIDGVNGMAGATAIAIALAIAFMAGSYDETLLSRVAFGLCGALLGFLVFNWPLGLVFLGDAGAYTVGHLLVWLAVILAWQVPAVTVVALSLLFFWPVADTFAAMRRRSKQKRKLTHPDYLHVHQLVMRALQLRYGGHHTRRYLNSLTALLLMPFIVMPILTAVLLREEAYLALLAWALYGAVFALSYRVLLARVRRADWRRSRRISNAAELHGQADVV